MTKIPRGKTETIKQRSLYIYLPSVEMVDDWKQRAEEEKKSVSKFVMLRVLESLGPKGGKGERVLRAEFAADAEKSEQEKKDLLAENEQLRQENRMLKMLGDNLDNELRRLRAQPFLEAGFVGTRKFDKGLVDLLRNGMPREYVKELRGDSRREAIDIYNHIDREELRKSYLACVPKLRV